MIARKRGKIINISSIAARRDPVFVPAYAAAKNALLTATRLLAKDLGPHNINVNAICPGMLWTGFWRESGSPTRGFRARLRRHEAARDL